MRILRNLALTAVVLALGAAFAQAQSLVEVAKKEKERRSKNKAEASRVITDRELAGNYGGLPATSTTSTSQTAAEGEEGSTTTASGEQGEENEEQDETKTQEYWQNRVKASKDKIAKLEQQLQSDDWGQGQRVGVDPRGQNNLGQRQQVEQQLAAARQELEAIRVEARRAGVPPGWVR
jgi:hypothetical protein